MSGVQGVVISLTLSEKNNQVWCKNNSGIAQHWYHKCCSGKRILSLLWAHYKHCLNSAQNEEQKMCTLLKKILYDSWSVLLLAKKSLLPMVYLILGGKWGCCRPVGSKKTPTFAPGIKSRLTDPLPVSFPTQLWWRWQLHEAESLQSNSRSGSPELVQMRVHSSLPLIPVLSQMNPSHTLPLVFKIQFNNIHISTPQSSKWYHLPFRFSN
jgi:hypothetical protein